MGSQRNVLFIVIDQLRADCIAGALEAHINLPNLRALAAEGVSFDAHYTVTSPCGPARASLLTGLYAMNHRSVRNGTPLSSSLTNVALEMRKGGYTPWLFGYTDTSLDPRVHDEGDPNVRTYEQVMPGFAEQLEMRYEESYPWRAFLVAQGYKITNPAEAYFPQAAPGEERKINDPAFYSAEHSDTAFLTNKTLEALAVRTQQNWFAHVTYIRPHPPFVAPVPYNRMYDVADVPLPVRHGSFEETMAIHPFVAANNSRRAERNMVDGFDETLDQNDDEIARTMRSVYFGLATEVDLHIGRLVAFLKDTGQYDSTLIVVGADHGELLGDHYCWGKQTFYDQAMRVPLIIRDPDNKAQHGHTVTEFTESVDVVPTILQWAGRTVPRTMDGRSLMPFLAGEEPVKWRQSIFFELEYGEPGEPKPIQQILDTNLYQSNFAVIRTKQHKFVHFNGGLPPLLFDLIADPDEAVNLADDPAYAKVLLAMTQRMLDHRMAYANRTLSDLAITTSGVVTHS